MSTSLKCGEKGKYSNRKVLFDEISALRLAEGEIESHRHTEHIVAFVASSFGKRQIRESDQMRIF